MEVLSRFEMAQITVRVPLHVMQQLLPHGPIHMPHNTRKILTEGHFTVFLCPMPGHRGIENEDPKAQVAEC